MANGQSRRSTAAKTNGNGNGKATDAVGLGLEVPRLFTTPGTHPYDEIEWERRNSQIVSYTGKVSFEQDGVEFPSDWSLNATNIVAEKYFRGKLNTPSREWSVRQIIDRVADSIVAWGEEQGRFARPQDAEAFSAELKHILVTQKASFNSPVWFNIGVPTRAQQASACQPYHSLVSTPEGLIPIGELVEKSAVGQKVFDANGLTKIVAVKANGLKEVLRVHTKSGHTLDVTADHLVWRSGTGKASGFVEAGSLEPGDQLHWYRTEAWGEGEIDGLDIAEAALAGWLQSDGFVGQYTGTNRSLTIEAITVTQAERDFVMAAIEYVFPDIHRHTRSVVTKDESLDCKRVRLYGDELRGFVDKWNLLVRGVDMEVPERLNTAPLPIVAVYLQAIFQAEGFVSLRESSSLIGLDMISERLIRGVQALLTRFGIYSRVRFKADPRADRKGCWSLTIRTAGDRRRFADEIGFIDPRKADKLETSFEKPGLAARESKRLEIERMESIGEMDVYDIQTESGEYLSSGGLRVHNCFILHVDDTMDSIADWYRDEMFIFKGGSGSGLNVSNLRSSYEQLGIGGYSSGPVSFMRGADAAAGTIKSGGATRRAAKMVVFNIDHPDIISLRDGSPGFIWCKAVEEKKARALKKAGFDMAVDSGVDAYSIQYQNANNSIRVTDEYMAAYLEGRDWHTRAVTTGDVINTYPARDVMKQISQAAWECADPGMQYHTTVNDWHTAPAAGPITASNPCSEYMHLDNSPCNLASINLLKFLRDDGTFDTHSFEHTVFTVLLGQAILCVAADYPTEAIGRNARGFRQLGIGYANLGALLMALGAPYDSDIGRTWAAAITSLMQGAAYRASARFAEIVGPYPGTDELPGFAHPENRDATLRVLRKHATFSKVLAQRPTASDRKLDKRLDTYRDEVVGGGESLVADAELTRVVARANEVWDDTLEAAERFGVENSQVSVLAPTGTIGFMMDCDTTGVEPDLALKKVKKMVGGGTMSIVNQTLPRALRRLGYNEEQLEAIVAYVDENNTVVGAPALRPEHYDVFACSFTTDNLIGHMGHIKMMAAVQPFISGAISKCVTGDTLVATVDGLVPIGSLHDGEAADTFRSAVHEVASLRGTQKTDAFYYGGVRNVIEVTLRSGHRITGTPNHRLLVATDGTLEWRRLDEIRRGEAVAQQYGSDLWSVLPPLFTDFEPSAPRCSQKDVSIPLEMTSELAFLLGAYVAEGHTTRGNWTVTITNSVDDVLERVAHAWRSIFSVEPRIVRQEGKCPGVVVSSKRIVEFLEYLGCGARASEKRIPQAILRSPKDMVLAFLQGLFLDAYATTASGSKVGICVDSPKMLDSLQAILTNLGIVHGRISKWNADRGKSYDEVYACGDQAKRLVELVPFLEPDKAARARAISEREHAQSTADIVPGIKPRELYEMLPAGTSGRNGHGTGRSAFAFLCDLRTKHVSRRTLERVAAHPGVVLPDWLLTILADGLHFSPVESVEGAGMREVFDLSVPGTHAFVGNGIVNHNTVNVPEQATVEDMEEIFFEGWRLGLKAVAMYRDNCKADQPLSAEAKTVEEVATVAPAGAKRNRLPKKRPSMTYSFRVADTEGYVNVGLYPESGEPGEVFIKVSKQGSTLAGVMDAFSISVSMGLQHGVPLETFVEKFMNMTFEPQGITDDPDVRFAKSLMDFIFRRLALDFLPENKRLALGIKSVQERTEALDAVIEVVSETPVETKGADLASTADLVPALDAPLCSNCGTRMRPAGSCFACESCGSTSGCS
jgi:ribonucleoside-diphosphate reductase alpha chain